MKQQSANDTTDKPAYNDYAVRKALVLHEDVESAKRAVITRGEDLRNHEATMTPQDREEFQRRLAERNKKTD